MNKKKFFPLTLVLLACFMIVGFYSLARPTPRQAVDIWIEGPEGELCGYSEHPVTVNWFEDFMTDETVTIRISKEAAFLATTAEDIVYQTDGVTKEVYDLKLTETETEKIMTFKVKSPIEGSTCSATFNVRTPIKTKEMKLSAKVGSDKVPTNPMGNFTETKFPVRPGLTIDTTADIILKDMEFDVFGLAAINCLPPSDHYRLSMMVYNGKDGKVPVEELSWVIDSETASDFGNIKDRDYRFTKAKFPNEYLDGFYTIRVSLSTEKGDRKWKLIDYVEKEILFRKNPPQTPKITRTPGGESIRTGQNVTITASYIDPEGVPISYEWIGRDKETQTYPTGRNVVQVRAIDAFGLESPWAADLFFVVNPDGSGGMKLTGPSSTIIEQGLDGYTIGSYTFTVPAVVSHNGKDYGRVRGLNQSGQWVQVNYGTTSNGITLSGTLPKGIYSKLEFYYYTNHTCMYNKSNITYSVKFDYKDGGNGETVNGAHPVNSINITNAISSMNETDTLKLLTEVLPADASDKSLSWTSSEPTVASVGADGTVIALKAGSTIITAISNSTPSVTKSFRLDVFQPSTIVRVSDIELFFRSDQIMDQQIIRMLPNEVEQLNANVLPTNAYDQRLIFTSSDPTVVEANKDGFTGNLEALQNGRVTITVESEAGAGPSMSFDIYVGIAVDNIALNKDAVSVFQGDELALEVTVAPADAFDQTIHWSSSDTSVATIDVDGKIKALSVGKTMITAVANDNVNLKKQCEVTVLPVLVQSISLTPNQIELEEGKTTVIETTVSPANATDPSILFESVDPTIASVAQDGTISALSVGTTKIKVSSKSNTDVVDYVDVTVKPPYVAVTGLEVLPKEVIMPAGSTGQIDVTVSPQNASDPSVIIESLDPAIAVVNASGEITALNPGFVRIKVVSVDNADVFEFVYVNVIANI